MQHLNIITYSIYLLISFYVTIKVGWICYKNGEVYLQQIFSTNKEWAHPINKMLLIGYYLVNLGYTVLNLSFWGNVHSLKTMLDTLSLKLSAILIILGVLHCFNIWILAQLAKKSMFSNKS